MSTSILNHTPHKNVQFVSLSFFLVFSGVNSVLVFGTSDYGDYAAISLSILYLSFGLSALFIVPIILNNKILTPKYCTFIGSLVEIVFISEYIIFINQYYLYLISIIQGIGISMYWIGSQRYVIECAYHYERQRNLKKGSEIAGFQGVYFSYYEASTFVSNLLSAILFTLKLSNAFVYTLFTIICCIGCGITLFADNLENNYKDEKDKNMNNNYQYDTFKKSKSIIHHSTFSTIKMWNNPKLQSLMLLSIYLGLFQEFEFGVFPTLIDNKSMKFFVMACYGISGAIFSKYFGKLSQQINKYYIITIGVLLNIIVYIMILNIGSSTSINALYFFVIAIMNGIIESSLFITLFTLYPLILGDSPETLSNAQFFQQFGLALGYFLYSILGFNMKIMVDFIFLFVAGCIFYKSQTIRKYINTKKEDDEILQIINVNNDNNKQRIITIESYKVKQDYMMHHDLESDGYESTYSEIDERE